jgi:hypothetical protein
MTEYPQHARSKQKILEMLLPLEAQTLEVEFLYHNPNNPSYDPTWEWKFDVYLEIGDRKIAIEVDGDKGHRSKKNHEQTKENVAKRKFKINHLRTKGIELYAWHPKDIIGRKKLDPQLFLEEMKLLH